MPTTFIKKSLAAIHHAKDFNQAIRMSRFLGEILWKNSTGQYELMSLENALVEKYASQFNTKFDTGDQYPFLHILTKAYGTGGHTRIVERLIHSDALRASAVLVTEAIDPHALKKLSTAKHGCSKIAKQPDSTKKIQAIIFELAKCRTVVLHLHPHDIESVIAVAIAKKHFGIHVLMYNHADHVFSYGHGVADRVLEISYFGWALRNKRLTQNKSIFTGIPLTLPSLTVEPQLRTDRGYLAAAGSAYKFKPGQGYSFPDFVSRLIKKIGIPFILVGAKPLRSWWWWPIFAREKLKAKPQVQFAPQMPHEKYVQYLGNATAYIDSFPMTGGTAFPEILSLGVPCFGVLTGAHGYTPADQLKSVDIDHLSHDLRHFLKTRERPDINLNKIIEQVYEAHDTEKVAKRVTTAMNTDAIDMPPMWVNPAAIDTRFYEKIWRAQKIFTFPIHTLPNLRLLLLFIAEWRNRNKLA